ncbi:hypothetical protein F6J84_09750 [Microbacterium caowuchunii]|uniref:hypothetical protein n=1 Tax=Microbacterium caowuchunii TaxID=2614638 RepID=UPI001245AD67|nr:hypothetical protein [Microbacterium caowuchunii]QEW00347.1 hypothetical protein F6J84_09750 [Microbacterium caowuchunii]
MIESRAQSPNHRAVVVIACIGTLLVIAYAGLALLQILVLNPLAAAPGRSLDRIHTEMAMAGESLSAPMAIGVLSVGVAIAVLALVLLARSRVATPIAAVFAYLLILVFGAPAYFVASFGAGMGLADTYLISGADRSPWAAPLYVISALAFFGAAAAGGIGLARSQRTSNLRLTRYPAG